MKVPSQNRAPTMEESSVTHQNGGSQPGTVINNKQNEETTQRSQYSIPGILHFIQHEWARFELERSQWEVDRAELQARIAFLQGERKGQENLKNDLVRRIKMLEYALKQERAKFHKLKYGVELQQGDMKPVVLEESGEAGGEGEPEPAYSQVSNVTWRQGRQLLRQYLQEIGYTDMIIDVRNLRVRSLLGLNNNAEQDEVHNGAPLNGNESNKRASETQGRRTPAKKPQPSSFAEAMILDTEAAVMANFEFLANVADVDMEDDDDMSDEADLDAADELDDVKAAAAAAAKRKPAPPKSTIILNEGIADDVDAEAEEVLNELNLLTESEGVGGDMRGGTPATNAGADWTTGIGFGGGGGGVGGGGGGGGVVGGVGGGGVGGGGPRSAMRLVAAATDDDNMDSTLGLGELAQLTVNNDAEAAYDIASSKEAFRKTWNAKYTLRSHFDGVRALAFHPFEPVLITASEDHTLKLWNLQKTVPAKKSASLDVEPLYTFRSHSGPVLCLAMAAKGDQCYSGGLDGAIHCWNLPSANIDPYDSFEPDVLAATLDGHADAVWGLAVNGARGHLLSCAADGTVKLWAPQTKAPLLGTYTSERDGVPCSVDFVRDEANKLVAAYSSAHCLIYDTETAKPVVRFELGSDAAAAAAARQINRVVCHPTLAVTITAHEDRHIRFWDNNTGKLEHSMVAHLDAVTSLAVDPNGLYLLSGSHDCSIRLWHLDNKTCVQEITAHRKKFDESILDVAFHPSRPYIASAGADALAKVFV